MRQSRERDPDADDIVRPDAARVFAGPFPRRSTPFGGLIRPAGSPTRPGVGPDRALVRTGGVRVSSAVSDRRFHSSGVPLPAEAMLNDGASLIKGAPGMLTGANGEDPPPDVGPDEPAAHAIRMALIVDDRRLREHDPAARLGDVEGVHRMRTSTRRLRSNLRLFRPLLAGDWADQLSDELKWLGKLLGTVRDSDVMQERLRNAADALADDLGPLFASMIDRHTVASAALREALEGQRYRNLLGHLSAATANVLLEDDAWERCRKALPALVLDSWRPLKKSGRALDRDASDEEYHEVRKLAKAARYNAESVAHALDPDAADNARRFAKKARKVQDILGEHQDAIVAAEEIRHIVAEWPADGPFNLAAGQLIERQVVAAREARSRFFKAWDRLDRKKNLHWMNP